MIREFRKDRSQNRIFPDQHRRKRVFFLRILLLFFLFTGKIQSEAVYKKSDSENFQIFLKEFQKTSSESLVHSFQKRHPSIELAPCSFEESGRFEKVIYLTYHCKEEKWPGFIYLGSGPHFWKNNPERISLGEVLKIGKKMYLEIRAFTGNRISEEGLADPKKNPRQETKTIQPIPIKEYKDNYGLQYFVSIAKHPAKRDLKSGKEIFFDANCPLIFLKKDSDFYWDKAVYYSFQASCIPTSPYSYIRIRSDFLGKIRVDDKDTDQVQEGAKYLGKLKIHSIEADKVLWQDAEIYNE
ncbi:hypothetical protein AB3N59_11730 [Leptospira sp. WS92.C1]